MYTVLQQLQSRANRTLTESGIESNIEYDNSIDPDIDPYNIDGQGYKLYVNEVDPKHKNGISLTVASDDDDGVTWHVDVGRPVVISHSPKQPDSDAGPGGYDDVQFGRAAREPSQVEDLSTNELLKSYGDPVKAKLDSVLDIAAKSDEIRNLFVNIVNRLNSSD